MRTSFSGNYAPPRTLTEKWPGLQADYDLRLARYEKERQIERDVEPPAALRPAMA